MISLSDRRWQEQIDFLDVSQDDLDLLKKYRNEVEQAARLAVRRLPEFIGKYRETREVFEGYSIDEHRQLVFEHMLTLAGGLLDDDYVHKRLTVGEVHHKVELAPRYYMSGFQLFFSAFVDVLSQRHPADGEQMARVLTAFSKLFNLDMQLILEAYFANYEAKIQHLAYYDELTGYPNRALFKDRVDSALKRGQRTGAKAAILLVNLDRFQYINDSFGRSTGDRLLKEAGARLGGCVRVADTLARIGGDEFAVFVSDMDNDDEPARVAQRLVEEMKPPFQVGDMLLTINPSIGIVIFPDDGLDAAALLERAEVAVHRAKEQSGGYRFYTPDMHDEVVRRLDTENALRNALDRGEFVLHYQPLFEIATRRLIGFEALLRWRREHVGWVGPHEFIPVAEETGLIVPIGEWVLDTAARQLKRWHERGYGDLKMSVNLSPVHLQRPDLTDRVGRILSDAGVDPQFVELEITENIMLNDAAEAVRVLTRLQSMGLSIAIDDFGTGYSSLRYLKDLPINRLKIDRSFVAEMASKPEAAGIVETVIALASGLRLHITAEGVETETQLQLLKERGADHAQGFFLGRPVPPDEAERQFLNSAVPGPPR